MDNTAKTYTIVPSPTLSKLEPILREHNIDYKLLYGEDIPDQVPEVCMWHGHKTTRFLACIESTLDPEKLFRFDEDLHRLQETPDFKQYMA